MEKKFERNTFTMFKVGTACSNEAMRKIYITEGTMRIMRHPMNDRMFAKDFPTQLRTKIHTTKILPSVAGLRFRRIDDYTYGVYRYCAESQKFDILAYQFVFDAPLPMDYDLGKLVEQKSMPEKSVHDMAEKSDEIEITADMLETLKSMSVYDLLKTIKHGTALAENSVMPEKVCPHCGKTFRGRPNKKYCCKVCQNAAQSKRYYYKHKGQNVHQHPAATCIACGKSTNLLNGAWFCSDCKTNLDVEKKAEIINTEYERRTKQRKTA